MARTLLGSLMNRTTTPVPFASRAATYGRGFLGYNRSNATRQMQSYGSVGTLFAIVHRTSNATSQVEWKLYRKARSGLKADRTEVTSHAALDLWTKPNPFMPRQEFVEGTQQHVDLVGEGWWVIVRHPNFNIPLEMWYVRPDRMRPVPDPEVFLAGYMYTGPDGTEIALGLDDVIQLRMPNPMDPYRGLGPVQSLMTDLDSSRYSAEWNRAFFRNGAEPGGILEVDRRLDDDEFTELRMRWNEQHKGVGNAHRVAIAEGGLKWVDRKLSQRDMQFAELRAISRDEIRGAFGMPKFAVGDVDDVNRATAEASDDWFAKQLTVPRLERIKAALNHDLLPMYGATAQGLEFDYVSPVTGSAADEADVLSTKATAAKTLIDAGAYGPEVLAALDLPALSFGQPDANPDRELLIKLLTGAPLLAPLLLPLLGFDLTESQRAAGPREVAELTQKLYLGVGSVLSAEEARQVLVDAGAALEPGKPVPPPPAKPSVPGPAAWLPPGTGLRAEIEDTDPSEDGDIEAAMRWVAVCENDDNSCQPCRANDGKTYRNREQAYKDYPGGTGYVRCVGAEHGNDCRCKVIKRREGSGT